MLLLLGIILLRDNAMTNNNPAIPRESLLFKPVKDAYGVRLALAFGNEAENGQCHFYDNECCFCDIGKGEGVQFTTQLNLERLEYFKYYYRDILPLTSHIIVYNSGSTLNIDELSHLTLNSIINYVVELPKCKVVSVESREHFINNSRINQVLDLFPSDKTLRIILGLETYDDKIRNSVLCKSMSNVDFERIIDDLGKYRNRIGIDVNVIYQPPGLIEQEAINEAIKTVKYSYKCAVQKGLNVDFNIHPYMIPFKRASIDIQHVMPTLQETLHLAYELQGLIKKMNADSHIFIGCQDEGHNHKLRYDPNIEQLLQEIELFNQNQ
jgi:hypothetical protein